MSLAEMLVTVAVLGLAAAIAIPQASSVTPYVAEAAAAEVAHALRYAQREAIRTGSYHVAEIDPATQTIRVFRLAGSEAEPNTPPMQPVDILHISLAGNGARATVAEAVFFYGSSQTDDIAFGADGVPVQYVAGQVPAVPMSQDGVVRLQSGAALRSVTVDKTNGRVSL